MMWIKRLKKLDPLTIQINIVKLLNFWRDWTVDLTSVVLKQHQWGHMFGHSATEHIVSIYMFFLEDPCEVALHAPYPATLTVATGESSHKRRFVASAAYPVKRGLVGSEFHCQLVDHKDWKPHVQLGLGGLFFCSVKFFCAHRPEHSIYIYR